jgi:hypothetical protein
MADLIAAFLLALVLLIGSVLPALASGFTFAGVSNRFITPNGDGRNDNVAFKYSNPFDSAGTVKIYNLRGHLLATIPITAGGNTDCTSPAPGSGCPIWDGRASGQIVSSGVYIYVVSAESVIYSGAVVVIR